MADVNDWAPVGNGQKPVSDLSDDWEAVSRPSPAIGSVDDFGRPNVPDAFIARTRAGEAIGRVIQAAKIEGAQGLGEGTPTGFSDEMLQFLIEKGVFHDPAKGRGGPLTMANEAVMMPAAQLWEAIARGTSAGIHGAGGAFGQLLDEFGVSNEPGLFFRGGGEQAKREVINAGNWLMIEAGMGRFARPSVERQADSVQGAMDRVMDRPVGGLPAEADFAAAAKVLSEPPPGHIRFYHGTSYEDASGFTGSTFVTPHYEYARNYRGGPNNVLFTDLTKAEAKARGLIDEVNDYPVNGSIEDGAARLKPMTTEANLKRMWREDGIHPAEAVHDAANDAFVKNEITAKPLEIKSPEFDKVVEELEGGKAGSLSAAATEPPDVPLDVQPASPPSSLIASATAAAERLFDIGRDIQMQLAPMARGSVEAMATVKDFMNAMRRNAWDSSRIDTDIVKRFSAEQRERMARAMEEESLSLRLGEPESARAHQGLNTLTPEERQLVLDLDTRQQLSWLRARDLEMVDGDGIPMHFPRMATGAKGDTEIGKPPSLTQMYGIRKNSPYLQKREYLEAHETELALKAKYGEQAKIAWDIRTVNLATKMLEDAIAGRSLINNIEEVGKRTGEDTVAVGFKPGDGWFTVDHPAFQKWRPKIEEGGVLKDEAGNIQFEQVPIYVRGDFEGPLRAALWGKSGAAYGALMELKGKTMSVIMNSPMIHNMVEFGRAFPAMPVRIFKAYFDGYRAKNDVAVMHEAINHGLVPIGKRFFNQDVNAIMEAPDLTPGRSLTSKILAAVPGLFDEGAGVAVKRAIDKAGDFWHNTLLWDRIADLQMGLYVNMRADQIAKGMDPSTASYLAAHWANRYAGALPKEAMSQAATQVSNFMLFSRSFTMGNLGVMKDMVTGLPKDVLAQIERDAGFKAGSIAAAEEGAANAVTSAKSMARRKAMMIIGMDVALMYAGNSVLQSALNVLLGGNTLDKEAHDYLRRFKDFINEAQVHPLSLLQPFRTAESLSASSENEPGRKERTLVGYAKDGTAIYGRNPVGKIGEEFIGYFTSPLDMLKKKEGTIMRPLMQIISNDAGFGRKIYDPQAEDWSKYAANVGAIVKHMVASQLPVGQLSAASDLIKGEGDKTVNVLQTVGPFLGFTFSKGAPGGPALGELYSAKSQHDFEVQKHLPDIRRQILRGDIEGAQGIMSRMGIQPALQNYYIRTTLNPALRLSPRSLRDFNLYATDEQKARMSRRLGERQPQ